MHKENKRQKIEAILKSNLSLSLREVAKRVGCDFSYVFMVRRAMVERGEIDGSNLPKQGRPILKRAEKPTFPYAHRTLAEVAPEPQDTHDEVNHPAHYTDGGIETIDFIQAKLSPEEFRGYCRGNAMKYLSRAGKKGDAATDLAKANWYLNRIKKDA